MKIATVTAMYNESELAQYYLKHYDYVDEIHIILDSATTDNTKEILSKDKRVTIHPMEYPPDGLDWLMKQARVNEVYKSLEADWVFAVDSDEFLYKQGEPDIKKFLSKQEGNVMWARLYQVYRHETDKDLDPSKPPLLQRTHGILEESEPGTAPTLTKAYIKPIVIRGGLDPKWDCGCHGYLSTDLIQCEDRMDGAHWHMADPELAIRRRLQTKARQGKRNIALGMGIQNHSITKGDILFECWMHRTEPIVIYENQETPTVSIIIACFNNLDYTKQCLESIEAFTPEKHEIVFIDNGSTDGTTEWIKEKTGENQNYVLIRNETNQGFVTACNQGARFAKGDYFLFLNNDTVVSKEWLTGLIDASKSASDIGCVGPRTNYISGPQQVNDPDTYDSIFKYQLYADAYRKAHRGDYVPFWRIVCFCLLVKKSIFNQVGGLDERFSPGNFEDDDLCLRIVNEKYRNIICNDVFIHHHGSVTCKEMDFVNILETNRKKFGEKWDDIMDKTISAVLIVKNEEANIEKCLTSLCYQVDEVVVVDTGSTDRTRELAVGFPNVQIYDFPWCDDFSAARNFANSKATKGWILSIDADEVITGLDKLMLSPFHAYRINTRTYNNNPRWANSFENEGEYPDHEQGMRWLGSLKSRLWPNDPRIVFEYPVHEVVEKSLSYYGYHVCDIKEVVVHHYGRLNDNYEYGRGDKYMDLLQKQLKSGINDLRSLEQIALQCQSMGKYPDARKFWDEILVLEPTNEAAFLNIGHCFAEEGDWEKALLWSKKALERNPESKDAAMNVATCEAMAGSLETAEKMCAEIMRKYPLYPLAQGLLNALEIQRGGLKDGREQNPTPGC